MSVFARTFTPDREEITEDGRTVTTVTMKRHCNGCNMPLGDVTDAEVERATAGLPLTDARAECPNCAPLVELEAAGCRTWQLTERTFGSVMGQIDRLRPWVFTKAYTEMVDGRITTVGLRVGEKPGHVVARFGDWIIRHPDGRWSVHAGPATDGSAA